MNRRTFPPELDVLMRRVAIARHERNALSRERDRLETLESDARQELEYREKELREYINDHVSRINVVSGKIAAAVETAVEIHYHGSSPPPAAGAAARQVHEELAQAEAMRRRQS